jgi:hypothetical protein
MLKEAVDFISAFQILPRHVSSGGRRCLTRVMSVLWASTDYDSSCVASCHVMYIFHDNWPHRTSHNLYTPTTQPLLEKLIRLHSMTTGHTGQVIIRIRPQRARFADVAAIKERVTAVLRSIPKEAFADSFQ